MDKSLLLREGGVNVRSSLFRESSSLGGEHVGDDDDEDIPSHHSTHIEDRVRSMHCMYYRVNHLDNKTSEYDKHSAKHDARKCHSIQLTMGAMFMTKASLVEEFVLRLERKERGIMIPMIPAR